MSNTPTEQLFRVQFMYTYKNGSTVRKVRYLRIVPTRKSLVFSVANNLEDNLDLEDVFITVESVPLCGGNPLELVNIKFSDLCAKFYLG